MWMFAAVATAATVLSTAHGTDPRTIGELAPPGCVCGRGRVVRAIGMNGPPTAETWWGLWLEGGALWLKAVDVQETSWDPEQPMPAVCSQGVEGQPLLLLHGVAGLSAGPVNVTRGGDDSPMWPGRILVAEGGYTGKPELSRATIRAFGTAVPGTTSRPRIADYRLVYQDERGSVDLADAAAFDGDRTVSVDFMGDVDRDGYVDVLVRSGQPDDLDPTVLLLTGGAPPGALLRPVAMQVHGTCC
jgi:hypothetical protein